MCTVGRARRSLAVGCAVLALIGCTRGKRGNPDNAATLARPIATLDADLAGLTGDHFRRYLQAVKGASQALATELQQGLDGVPPPAAAAEAPAA